MLDFMTYLSTWFVQHEISSHLLIILSLYIITWQMSIRRTEWLIDDDHGIAPYSEHWVHEKDPSGKIVGGFKVDSYKGDLTCVECKIGRDCVRTCNKDCEKQCKVNHKCSWPRRKFLSIIPELGFPGMLIRWARLQVGKSWREIGKNVKGHSIKGYVQDPFKHHVLSFIVQFLNLILAYSFLYNFAGPKVALYATLAFSVFPIVAQPLCWISGIPYLVSLFGVLATLNVSTYIDSYYFSIPLTLGFTAVAGLMLLPGCFVGVILLFLGYGWAAFAAGVIGVLILARDGLTVVGIRTTAFKKQNMGASTIVTLYKPIIMIKTFWYYIRMTLLPMKMGLYHEWGYHFDEQLNKLDRMFWCGLLSIAIFIIAFLNGPPLVQLALVWYVAFFAIFSNLITAQQFVADRYIFIPALGFCMLLSYLPSYLFYFLLGLYVMRSFLHIWTFRSQEDFYLSNWLNFRGSEVALGNLGVVQRNAGMPGASVDTWSRGTKINPFYDVNWYNLYSAFKSAGALDQAKVFLQKCLDSKIVHFHEQWDKEMKDLEIEIERRKGVNVHSMNKVMEAL